MRTSRRTFLAASTGLAAFPALAQPVARDQLAAAFADPPDAARPRVWWHWMNGNITKEGIAADLAWMRRVGIGGVQNFDAALATPQVVQQRLVYMSPEWKDAFRFAVQRAASLDLEFAIAASPGWSETGGPWVPPSDGMKKLVWSETLVEGGAPIDAVLPAPPADTGPYQSLAAGGASVLGGTDAPPPIHYSDVAVLAYPIAGLSRLDAPAAVTTDGEPIDATKLSDGDLKTGIAMPASSNGRPGYLQFNYGRTQTVRTAVVFVTNLPPAFMGATMVQLEASANGRTWRNVANARLRDVPTTMSFEPVRARYFRVSFPPAGGMDTSFFSAAPGVDMMGMMAAAFGMGRSAPPETQLTQFELLADARVDEFEAKAGFSIADDYFALGVEGVSDASGVAPRDVLNITEHMDAAGRLHWSPPPGRWKVLRLGCSLTGKTNHPATAEATGLEVDKYDGAAVARYLNTYLDTYRDALGGGRFGVGGLSALLTDSIEVGASNWTPRMIEQFQSLRGYDPTPWLPALTGEIVGSRARSDAFLYDFRRTLADLIATEHYGVVARVAHERGLIVYGESLEGSRVTLGDDLDMRGYADIPMAALWSYATAPRPIYVADGRGAASIAHLRGRKFVACESLTSIGQPWTYAPRDLQPMIDAIFANGVNRPVIHTSVHQPTEAAPGLSLAVFGQFFTRHETWAEMAGPWMDYIARCSHMLQQGKNVADVAYFYGEETPVAVQAAAGYMTDAPKRYAYDFVSAGALTQLLSVERGEFVSEGGARYKILYLNPRADRMTLPVLRKLAEFVDAGAVIVGDAPTSSPSLSDDAGEFSALVARLWGGGATTRAGAGQVFAGRDTEAALAAIGVVPDFSYTSSSDADLTFVHRKLDDGGDIYFICNRADAEVAFEARFRSVGRAAELWRADSGQVEDISYRLDGATTLVPLTLGAKQSCFVVFRRLTSEPSATIAAPSWRQVGLIDGAWDVVFQDGRGAPARAHFAELRSLSEQEDPGIKHFSGVASYSKSFAAPVGFNRGDPLWIDLGQIGEVAEVRVNGHVAGVAWKAPNRVNIGAFVRGGQNQLQIDVANLWVNRLIGDAQPGAERIAFTTLPTFTAQAPLRPSGLMGPVTLWQEAAIERI